MVAENKLLKGMTIGVDATTLETSAALRTIARRVSGEGYEEFLARLAEESGIATPTLIRSVQHDRDNRSRLHRSEAVAAPHLCPPHALTLAYLFEAA